MPDAHASSYRIIMLDINYKECLLKESKQQKYAELSRMQFKIMQDQNKSDIKKGDT